MNGAAQEASPNLICGTSWSSSRLDNFSVILAMSNCRVSSTSHTNLAYLLQRAIPLGLLMSARDGLVRLDQLRVRVPQCGRRRWRGLVEPLRDLDLLLVHFFHPFQFLVLGNRFEIVLRAIEQGHTNIGLFERADIVRPVPGHERDVSRLAEGGEDECLLRRRDSRVHPCVLDEHLPRRQVFVLLQGGTGDANVVVAEQGWVERFRRVDGDNFGLFDVSPYQL